MNEQELREQIAKEIENADYSGIEGGVEGNALAVWIARQKFDAAIVRGEK